VISICVSVKNSYFIVDIIFMLAASIAVSIKKRFGMYLSVCLFVPPLHQALNQDEAAEMASLVNVLT